jgi:hypothetical protein
MPIVVRLRHEMFTEPVSEARLAATAAVHELVLVGVHQVVPVEGMSRLRQVLAPRQIVVVLVDGGTPARGRALIEELLNDGVIPVVLTGHDPPPADLTSWISTACQDAAPAIPPGAVTKTPL